MTPLPPLELFRKFIRFGIVTRPLLLCLGEESGNCDNLVHPDDDPRHRDPRHQRSDQYAWQPGCSLHLCLSWHLSLADSSHKVVAIMILGK